MIQIRRRRDMSPHYNIHSFINRNVFACRSLRILIQPSRDAAMMSFMATPLVIPTDPIARKNLWRDWIRHDPPQVKTKQASMKRHHLSRLDQRFDVALILNDIKSDPSVKQYRIDPKSKPTWHWVASILFVEAAVLMLAWKIFVGF